MKEATGEGSMTIITIVVIAALAAAAALIVGVMISRTKNEANDVATESVKECPIGQEVDLSTGECKAAS